MRSAIATAVALLTASAALPHATLNAQAAGPDDPTIVAIFDAANTADMETGALAEQQGASREVRDFGAMLVRDHRAVRQQGRDLAAKLGVTPTPPKDDQSAKDHAAAVARLRGLKGAQFDRAFLQHEAAFHQAVINAVQSTLLPAIDHPELKALVEKVAPAFQAHMQMAQELEKKVSSAS
jgi:putative membrane protein